MNKILLSDILKNQATITIVALDMYHMEKVRL